MLKLEAHGKQDGWPQTMAMTLYHDDGYVLTAVPVVATLLQLIDGSARQPGLHYQAHIVQPGRLIKDMARMGIEIHIRHSAFATEAVPSGMFT
jgi:saccharopine dehydrogenase (NAD+, L-lysine-forming)